MAITWNKIIPRWGGDAIEPPETKKDTGYIAGDKPPAKWENWLRKGTYEALDETRDVIEDIDSQLAQIVNYVTPFCSVYHNVNQSVATGVLTTLSFNSERADTKGMHDLENNNSRLTCKESGKYLITTNVVFSVFASASVRSVSLRLNGNTVIANTNSTPPASNVEVSFTLSTKIELNENDYVEVVVFQATGSTLNIKYEGNNSPEFKMIKVG